MPNYWRGKTLESRGMLHREIKKWKIWKSRYGLENKIGSMCPMRIAELKERRETMANVFPEFEESMCLQNKEAYQILNKINKSKSEEYPPKKFLKAEKKGRLSQRIELDWQYIHSSSAVTDARKIMSSKSWGTNNLEFSMQLNYYLIEKGNIHWRIH